MTAKEYDNLPQEIKNIIDVWDEDADLYIEASEIKANLNKVGWTCDYGLDGMVHSVRRMKDSEKFVSLLSSDCTQQQFYNILLGDHGLGFVEDTCEETNEITFKDGSKILVIHEVTEKDVREYPYKEITLFSYKVLC